ncbi:MAG: hypothetical protein ACOX2O_00890 [Bdellovibrionota bacterium]|jgi:hypothetical protein
MRCLSILFTSTFFTLMVLLLFVTDTFATSDALNFDNILTVKKSEQKADSLLASVVMKGDAKTETPSSTLLDKSLFAKLQEKNVLDESTKNFYRLAIYEVDPHPTSFTIDKVDSSNAINIVTIDSKTHNLSITISWQHNW